MNDESRDRHLEKQLDAYVKGNLTESEAQELWVKLMGRPDYIELLETELAVKALFAQQASETGSEKSVSGTQEPQGLTYILQRSWKWAAAAAVIIVLIISMNLFQIEVEPSLQEIAISDINIAENLITAPVVRSDSHGQQSPVDSMLNHGYQLAISGDLNKAMAVYNEIIERFGGSPATAKAFLNRGIIQYNGSIYQEAISSFDMTLSMVQKDPVTEEKAYWYLGNAYIHTDSLQKARNAIQKVHTMDNIYRKPAGRLLQKLDSELDNRDVGESN